VAQSRGKSGTGKRPSGRRATGRTDRRHSRFAVNLPVRVTRVTGGPSRGWRGRTANLSGGGLAVELPTRLSPGTRVAIEVRTAIGPLRMEADVLWTQRVPGGNRLARHGLCLAERSEVMDLPIYALLGQWLVGLAKREEAGKAKRRSPRPTRRSRTSRP
jgi:hypothetical protein